jgi:hypothetical protein
MKKILNRANGSLSFVGNFSLGIFTEAINIGGVGFMNIPSTQGDHPGIVGFGSVGEGSSTLNLYISFEEIVALVKPIAPILLMFTALG